MRRSAGFSDTRPVHGEARAAAYEPTTGSKTRTMHTRSMLPAKLTPPCVRGLVAREGVYARLDARRSARLVWVSAPGGTGKTLLVAAYLAARERPTLWLRLDAADGHVDTFAHFLRAAAEGNCREAPPTPPRLAASTEADVALRRWLEALFARLPRGFAIVLDEYQTLLADASLHGVLSALVESLPADATVFVTSRDAPPVALARIASASTFERVDAEAMRFAEDEALALAANMGVADGDMQRRIARASGGWAAGVVLLCRAALAGVPVPQDGSGLPREMLDYFSAEVFDRLPPDVREFLLRTAAMPWLTLEVAATLTACRDPESVLDALHRANLFIERKRGEPALYVYHPLFRRFLAARARDALDPSALREIRRVAAATLAQAGEPEAAVPLYAALGEWDAIAALVREHAPRLAGFGRVSTLHAWLALVPDAATRQRPWLMLWRAWCRHAMREPDAAAGFERAYLAFAAGADIEGEFAACTWLLRLADSRTEADRWVGEIERIAARLHDRDDPALEAAVIAGFAAAQRFPSGHWLIERWRERARVLARSGSGLSAAMRLKLASFALARDLEHGAVDVMSALLVEIGDTIGADEIAPGDALAMQLLDAYRLLHLGVDAAAAAALDRVETAAAASGAPDEQFAVALFAFRLAIARGDVAAARRRRVALAQAASGTPEHALARLLGDAELALLEGDASAAAAAAGAAAHAAALCPNDEPVRVACLAAAMLARDERPDAVLRLVAPALEAARRAHLPAAEQSLQLLVALAHVRDGDTGRALATVADAMRLGASTGMLPRTPALPRPMLAELAAFALEHGVEPRYAERIVVRLGLPAPTNATARWPWPIRVRTLGTFAVESRVGHGDGPGRNARKPYELLKYIAAGGGRELAAGRAIAALWPDLEGDAAKKTFDITLHRLRKALGSDAAVRLEGGKLTLDPQLVWVDATAFERLAAHAESLLECGDPQGERELQEALALYAGHFLAADDDLPWVVPHRARLRDRFVRLADLAGARCEATGDWQRAERHYRQAIALEPTAETIHQRLIRALAEMGRPAEALDAYRRCRELLSIVLGMRPSPRTEALCDRIRADVGRAPVCGE